MALDPAVEKALSAAVGDSRLATEADALAHYGRDTCDLFRAAPSAVVFPASTEEVVAIVEAANAHGLALVPSGGRTGLSGGATASNGEVVVSLERMNRILDSNAADRTVRCQAGVVTAKLQDHATELGLYYPVNYAATGSSHIAGNIATNAGGNRVIRYGMTRAWVAALQVVTGKGEVLELGRGLHKDNTGYALHQLFIGSEGTLGFITEATVRLTRAPGPSAVMVLGLEQLADLLPVLEAAQAHLTVNAFEFFTEGALEKVIARHALQRPFDAVTPVYALVEVETGAGPAMDAVLEVYEHCTDESWVRDGVISQSDAQAAELWRLRDDISETLSRWSPYKNDLSVRVSLVPEFLSEVERMAGEKYPDFEVLCYGHIGDGNVHLNVLKPDDMSIDDFKARCGAVSEDLFSLVERFEGSVSAEHGVGLLKKPYLGFTRSAAEIELMRGIRRVFDPNGVMNPGKIFDGRGTAG